MRGRQMAALPADVRTVPGDHLTGVACPSCPGVLTARADDDDLTFICRVGHVFSLEELITLKEQRVQEREWNAILALEELAALLRDAEVFPGRMATARQEAQRLRQLVDATEPARSGGGRPSPERPGTG